MDELSRRHAEQVKALRAKRSKTRDDDEDLFASAADFAEPEPATAVIASEIPVHASPTAVMREDIKAAPAPVLLLSEPVEQGESEVDDVMPVVRRTHLHSAVAPETRLSVELADEVLSRLVSGTSSRDEPLEDIIRLQATPVFSDPAEMQLQPIPRFDIVEMDSAPRPGMRKQGTLVLLQPLGEVLEESLPAPIMPPVSIHVEGPTVIDTATEKCLDEVHMSESNNTILHIIASSPNKRRSYSLDVPGALGVDISDVSSNVSLESPVPPTSDDAAVFYEGGVDHKLATQPSKHSLVGTSIQEQDEEACPPHDPASPYVVSRNSLAGLPGSEESVTDFGFASPRAMVKERSFSPQSTSLATSQINLASHIPDNQPASGSSVVISEQARNVPVEASVATPISNERPIRGSKTSLFAALKETSHILASHAEAPDAVPLDNDCLNHLRDLLL